MFTFKNVSSLLLFMFSFDSRLGRTRDSDEENDLDDEDSIANAIGCLGPLSGFLAPELQKYQKQMKGKSDFFNFGKQLNLYDLAEIICSSVCESCHGNVFSMHTEVTAGTK